MEVNNPYYNAIISTIPKDELKRLIQEELLNLMMDFGQKVTSTDPEFEHIKNRTYKILMDGYSSWRMGLFDQCVREGKVNRFDKSTRITVQRIELWLSSYEKQCNYNSSQSKGDEIIVYPYPHEWYEKTAARFIPIINFRMAKKPDYDSDEWTLENIETTEEYKSWKKRNDSTKLELSKLFRR